MAYCKICGGYECKKHTSLFGGVRKISEFSGSSPPEVFVGRWNYPNVYVGILSPEEYGDTRVMSSAEEWHSRKLGIPQILKMRNQLIYARKQDNIKKAVLKSRFLGVLQEVAMTHKSVSTEFKLKKPVTKNDEKERRVPLISNAAIVERARLQENTRVKKKVDYLVNDTDVKSVGAILELEKSGIRSSDLVKLLSAGLLGLKKNRKLVPTRWSITAVDDTLSKYKLKKIKYYPSIQDFRVFSSEYLGNHYEFLLLPSEFSFEVIEVSMKNFGVWHDHESFFPRRKYADSVTGAYYANRLALTEYLERIQRQAACVVFREIRPEYYAPLGVGILREASRESFRNKGEKFDSLGEALGRINSRLRLDLGNWKEKSVILSDFGKQKRIWDFIS
jgi:DNA repair protein NreA